MIQPKNSVRLLNYFGIGLVALPEPVTTAFGVGLLLAANHLSQKLEPALDNLFPEALAYQSYWFKRSVDYIDVESSAPGMVKLRTQSEDYPIPRRYVPPEASAYQSYWFKRSVDYADVQTPQESAFTPFPIHPTAEREAAPPIGEPVLLPDRKTWY